MGIYNFKIFENTQQAKSLLKKFHVPENNETYLEIKKLLKNNTGYLGFFVKMWLEESVSFQSLKDLFDATKSPYIHLLDNDIISYTKWETLMDDLLKAKSEWKYKSILNELPSAQKDLLVTDKMRPLFISLFDRKDKDNYLRRVSRYRTSTDLFNSLTLFLSSDPNSSFNTILRNIKSYDIKLIYKNEKENIILVQVDTCSQLKRIASDSSWCILSDSTFKSYNNGIYRQFVVFLTDMIDNYKKIGITYGLRLKTAHLLDDKSIGKDQLEEILSERGFHLENLKISLDNIDFNKTSLEDLKDAGFSKESVLSRKENLSDEGVNSLIKFGFTMDEIMEFKKSFNKQDLNSISKEDIEKYNILDKIEIYDLGDIIDKSLSWIINNKERIKLVYGKIGVGELIKINPTPREIKELKDLDKKYFSTSNPSSRSSYSRTETSDSCIFYKNVKEFLSELDKDLDKISFWYFDDESYYLDVKLYILRYKGVGPQNFEWIDVLKYFKGIKRNDLSKVLDFLKLNGWVVTTDMLIELCQGLNFDTGRVINRNPLDIWFKLLEEYPQLKEHVDKIVYYFENPDLKFNKEDYENVSNFMSKNKISTKSYLDIYSKKILDGYPKLKEMCDKKEFIRRFNKCLPKYTTQNYNGREITTTLIEINNDWRDITPEIIVDYFYPKLKDDKFSYNTPLIYVICSLIKTGNIDKLNELKFSLSQEQTIHLIRIFFNLERYNSTAYIREDFQLTDSEKELFFDWLIKNKEKIRKNYSNEVVIDMDSYRQLSLGLIYYYYDWGFQSYFNLAKKFKNQKDEWINVDGVDNHQKGITRIDFFKEIFNYFFIKKDRDSYDRLVNKIKTEMVLKKYELKQLEDSYRSSWMSSGSFESSILGGYI